MEDKEILKQFKEISNNLMSRCSPDSDIYPLVTALISLFNAICSIFVHSFLFLPNHKF